MTPPSKPLSVAVAVLCLCGVCVSSAFAALELSTDHRALFFGLMRLGEERTLAQSGSYHNEVTCASTGGGTWYLKISVLQPLASGADEIPLERFQWEATGADGTGTLANAARWRSFTLFPELVYLSGPGEADGRRVRLRFRYAVQVPEAQTQGVYHTTIRFTLTEVL